MYFLTPLNLALQALGQVTPNSGSVLHTGLYILGQKGGTASGGAGGGVWGQLACSNGVLGPLTKEPIGCVRATATPWTWCTFGRRMGYPEHLTERRPGLLTLKWKHRGGSMWHKARGGR
jgi:hypothetical protein